MPIFHEQVILAAVGNGKHPNWLRPEHVADWRGLAQALDRICPEQRCDAIHADWLLHHNRSASEQNFA